jgi:UDP:flavonoid glycosyltransferase YjiC (YdhE family)
VHEYADKTPPLTIISDFFASSALDAGDYLSVPVIGMYPNPLGMTTLLAPELRGWLDIPLLWWGSLAEAIIARVLLLFRNRERSQRSAQYWLPPLSEQDIFPSPSMQRPILASTALGFEYASAHSPLLQFMGASPPCNHLTRTLQEEDPALFEWLEQQELVVYVAFGTMHHFTEKTVNVLFDQLKSITSASHPLLGRAVSVLWSLPAAQQSLLHSSRSEQAAANIRLETFVPQWDVLSSPKVEAFVSHCGANSLYESLLTCTPLVCCPGMADQPANAARVESVNAGVISRQGVHSVEASLLVLFSKLDTCTDNARRVRDIFRCQGGASTGVDFMERIINCGARRLTPHESLNHRYSWTKWMLLGGLTVVSVSVLFYLSPQQPFCVE